MWQPYTTVGYVAAIPESVEAYGAPAATVNTPHVSSSPSARVGLLYGSTTGGDIKGPAKSYHYLTLQVGTHYQFSSWARAGVGVTVNGTLNKAPIHVRHLYGISGRTFALPIHTVTYLPEWTLGICARIDVML
jgi:hypothetical protein